MRLTLLQVVQAVLNDMDSDGVNSVSDTEESLQVASIARDVYFSMVDELQVPGNMRILQPDAAGVGYPNFLKLPDEVKRLDWVRYNCRVDIAGEARYNDITYLPPDEFIYLVTKRNSTDSNIETVNHPETGVPLFIINDHQPTYWTSFDDKYLCFDSYLNTVDTELQSSQCMVYAEVSVEWDTNGSAQIPLPDHLQSLYLAEVKSTCFVTLKQALNEKTEQAVKRLRFTLGEQKDRTDQRPRRPNYGRR